MDCELFAIEQDFAGQQAKKERRSRLIRIAVVIGATVFALGLLVVVSVVFPPDPGNGPEPALPTVTATL